MQESFEKMLPSYIGTSIENKPARLKRNEKFHAQIHKNIVPTIEQTIQIINSWLEYKNSRPCPNCKTKTVAQMLEGIKKQEINERILDDLMLAQEVKTITSQGIRFLKADYFSDELYGIRQKVIIKYSLFDLSYIKVYTLSGRFLCKAERSTLTHPLAHYTGEIKDMEDFKQKIQKQKQLKNKTIKAVRQFLDIEDLGILECEMAESEAVEDVPKIEVVPSLPAKEKYNPIQKPERNKIFKTNFERYEFLMKNGCTNNDERNWLRNYKNTKECIEYEKSIC